MARTREILLSWTSQPQEAVELDWSGRFADGLAFHAPLSPAMGLRDLVSGQVATNTGLASTIVDAKGQFFNFGASRYCDFASKPKGIGHSTPATVAWLQDPRATSSDGTILNCQFGTGGVDHSYLIYQLPTDSSYYFTAGPRQVSRAVSWSSAVGSIADGTLDIFVLVARAGFQSYDKNDYDLYRNGVLLTAGSNTSFGTNTADGFRVGGLIGGASNFDGGIGYLTFWSRAFNADDARVWSENPNGLYATQRIDIPVSAGGAGTTISGALGTATASGFTGTVNANRTIAGALGTATASGFQGTVSNSLDTTIAGNLGTAVASGFAGNVDANRTIAGALGTASALGYQGGVSNTNDTVIGGNLGTAVASGFAGTVVFDTIIAGGLGTAQALGYAGGVTNGEVSRRHAGGYRKTPARKGYIIRGKRYWLTDDELAVLVAQELATISRKEVKQVTVGKPKPISKKVWDLIAPMERLEALTPIEYDEGDDEEALMLML